MTCSCPKCQAQIEIDISGLQEKGTFIPCSECKNRFWVAKEAYARMSLKKEGNIYCDQCGKELEHKIVCAACGVMYPDFYLVQASKPPRRQVEKGNLLALELFSSSTKPTYSYEYRYKEAKVKETAGWSLGLSMKIVSAVAVVLLIAASLGFLYHVRKLEQQYANNYIRALYAIKTGNDLSLDTCTKITTEWKSKGQNVVPQISAEDEARLNKVKEVADRYMQRLKDPPKKFAGNKEKLANLYEIYAKTNVLALAPSGSLSTFENEATKTKNDFYTSIAALKDSMPSALSEEFQKAQKKYKRLQNI